MQNIKAAVVGAGFIGPVHVEALRRLGVTVTGILGCDSQESESARKTLGLPKAYRDLDELLTDDSVDSVHLAVPNVLHYEFAKRALEAGKHVMTFSDNVTVEDEKALKVFAAERGLLVMGPDCGTAIINGIGLGFANEVPRGEVGRLAVRGPIGCRYLGDARQTDYVKDGWNITGDSFTMDEDGYLHFAARNDDMIISSGYNIAGPEVEAALLSHPFVSECGVVGTPDEARGCIVQAHVVLVDGTPGDRNTIKALQDHVKETIAPYKYPRDIRFLKELPKTYSASQKSTNPPKKNGIIPMIVSKTGFVFLCTT